MGGQFDNRQQVQPVQPDPRDDSTTVKVAKTVGETAFGPVRGLAYDGPKAAYDTATSTSFRNGNGEVTVGSVVGGAVDVAVKAPIAAVTAAGKATFVTPTQNAIERFHVKDQPAAEQQINYKETDLLPRLTPQQEAEVFSKMNAVNGIPKYAVGPDSSDFAKRVAVNIFQGKNGMQPNSKLTPETLDRLGQVYGDKMAQAEVESAAQAASQGQPGPRDGRQTAPQQRVEKNLDNAASGATVLKEGDRGAGIKELQQQINKRFDELYSNMPENRPPRLAETGYYGKDTKAAVTELQKELGLNKIDGKVGKETGPAIMASRNPHQRPVDEGAGPVGPPAPEPALDPNGQTPAPDLNGQTPIPDPNAQTPIPDPSAQTPAPDPNGQTPILDPNGQSPVPDPNGQTPVNAAPQQDLKTDLSQKVAKAFDLEQEGVAVNLDMNGKSPVHSGGLSTEPWVEGNLKLKNGMEVPFWVDAGRNGVGKQGDGEIAGISFNQKTDPTLPGNVAKALGKYDNQQLAHVTEKRGADSYLIVTQPSFSPESAKELVDNSHIFQVNRKTGQVEELNFDRSTAKVQSGGFTATIAGEPRPITFSNSGTGINFQGAVYARVGESEFLS